MMPATTFPTTDKGTTMQEQFTPAQALNHPKLGFMDITDLNVTDEEISRAVSWFRWLCRLSDDSAPELLAAAREDVCQDMELLVMLCAATPAAFRKWFSRDDHGIYCLTEATGSEAWAQSVMARCVGAVQ